MTWQVIVGQKDRLFKELEEAKKFAKQFYEAQICQVIGENFKVVRFIVRNGQCKKL